METEIEAFPFQELNQTTMNTEPINPNIISSWVYLDDIYTPAAIPQELQDLQMVEDHLFNFTTPNFDIDPFSLLPTPDSPFLLDLYDFDPQQRPESTTDSYHPVPAVTENEFQTFLNDNELGLIAPAESTDESIGHRFFDSTTTTTMMLNSSEDDMLQTMVMDTNATDTATAGHQRDDEENEDETDDDPKPGTLNCKNLVSERNRRKRLSQQLLALRALVPNITKMDKRSVLVDALSYLRNIHEETARIQKELKEQRHLPRLTNLRGNCQDNPAGTFSIPRTLAHISASKPKAQITEIETEKIEDRRFVIKITCKGGLGVSGDILRVIESLCFEITFAASEQIKPQQILTTIFIRVKKPVKMTEEKLKDCITSTALRTGLTFQQP